MNTLKFIVFSMAFTLLTACSVDITLTKEEKQIQSVADSAVAEILFDSGLDSLASYSVRKDGDVKIEFSEAVSMIDYTLVVEQLRAHKAIQKVYAEQSGSSVCPLK